MFKTCSFYDKMDFQKINPSGGTFQFPIQKKEFELQV